MNLDKLFRRNANPDKNKVGPVKAAMMGAAAMGAMGSAEAAAKPIDPPRLEVVMANTKAPEVVLKEIPKLEVTLKDTSAGEVVEKEGIKVDLHAPQYKIDAPDPGNVGQKIDLNVPQKKIPMPER